MADVFVVKWNNLKIYVTFPRGMAKRVDNNCTLSLSSFCHARHDGVTLVCTQTIFFLFFFFGVALLVSSSGRKSLLQKGVGDGFARSRRGILSDFRQ